MCRRRERRARMVKFSKAALQDSVFAPDVSRYQTCIDIRRNIADWIEAEADRSQEFKADVERALIDAVALWLVKCPLDVERGEEGWR